MIVSGGLIVRLRFSGGQILFRPPSKMLGTALILAIFTMLGKMALARITVSNYVQRIIGRHQTCFTALIIWMILLYDQN